MRSRGGNSVSLVGKGPWLMSDILGGSSGQLQGPSGVYSTTSNVGASDTDPSNIVDGPGGTGGDPTVSRTREAKDEKKNPAGRNSPPDLTWQQRALRFLSEMETAKGYRNLSAELRAEVRALIDDAPESAFS
jgi:hypothetical protein